MTTNGLDVELTPEEITMVLRTREVEKLSAEFIRIGYEERRRDEAFEMFVAEDLIEHNPEFCDGRYSSARFIAERAAARSADFLPTDQWHLEFDQVLVKGDLLFIRRHVYQLTSSAGRVFWDIWRWEGEQIVEHWDVIQEVPQDKVNPRTMW